MNHVHLCERYHMGSKEETSWPKEKLHTYPTKHSVAVKEAPIGAFPQAALILNLLLQSNNNLLNFQNGFLIIQTIVGLFQDINWLFKHFLLVLSFCFYFGSIVLQGNRKTMKRLDIIELFSSMKWLLNQRIF